MTSDVQHEQLIHTPHSSGNKLNTQLGYLSSYDGVIDKDYAFVIYKEVDTKKGEWKLKVKSKQTADSSIDPSHPGFRRRIAEAAKAGKDYFVMGFCMTPRDDDPRKVENRIYFDEALQPACMQLHVVTRKSDGSAAEERIERIDWPEEQSEPAGPLLSLPKAKKNETLEELAYLHGYDVIANADYAFLAYSCRNTRDDSVCVKVKSKVTASSTIDPESSSLRRRMRDAQEQGQGQDYVLAGFSIEPKGDDPRLVHNRVFFDETMQPTRVEMHLVTRNADGSAKEKQVAEFVWPA